MGNSNAWAKAGLRHQEALALTRKVGSKYDVAGCLCNYSIYLKVCKKFPEAEAAAKEALELYSAADVNSTYGVASAYSALAGALHNSGKLVLAKLYYEKAIEAAQKSWSTKAIAEFYGDYTTCLLVLHDTNAVNVYRKMIQLRQQVYGRNDLKVLSTLLYHVSQLTDYAEDYAEAAESYRQMIDIYQERGTNGWTLERAYHFRGQNCLRAQKYAEAEKAYEKERALQIQRRASATRRAITDAALGRCLADWVWAERHGRNNAELVSRAAKAENLLTNCLAVYQRGTNPVDVADTKSRLGSAILTRAAVEPAITPEARQQSYQKAESLLQEAFQGMQGADTMHKKDGLERIVRCYEAWMEYFPNSGKEQKLARAKRDLDDFIKAQKKAGSRSQEMESSSEPDGR